VLITFAVFALIFAIVLGAYWFFVLRLEDQEDRALKNRLKTARMPRDRTGFVKSRENLSSVDVLDKLLARSDHVADPIRRLINRAGLKVNVGTIVLACIFCAFMTLALAVQLLPLPSILYAIPFAVAAGSIPIFYLRWAAAKRLATFEEQFPEAIDLLARALRAGHALTTALQMAGEEIPDPVGTEFKLVFDQQNYGMSLPEALKGMASRIPLLDARIFVTALLTQRETGGNLSEVLDNIASVIRERFKVKRQVRVISAHGRITGWVLGLLPPAMAVILFILSPSHILMLRDDPLGVDITFIGIGLQIIGVLIIRRIIDVEY
jgi:tight adherence protein B